MKMLGGFLIRIHGLKLSVGDRICAMYVLNGISEGCVIIIKTITTHKHY